jgi:hypothetical protein
VHVTYFYSTATDALFLCPSRGSFVPPRTVHIRVHFCRAPLPHWHGVRRSISVLSCTARLLYPYLHFTFVPLSGTILLLPCYFIVLYAYFRALCFSPHVAMVPQMRDGMDQRGAILRKFRLLLRTHISLTHFRRLSPCADERINFCHLRNFSLYPRRRALYCADTRTVSGRNAQCIMPRYVTVLCRMPMYHAETRTVSCRDAHCIKRDAHCIMPRRALYHAETHCMMPPLLHRAGPHHHAAPGHSTGPAVPGGRDASVPRSQRAPSHPCVGAGKHTCLSPPYLILHSENNPHVSAVFSPLQWLATHVDPACSCVSLGLYAYDARVLGYAFSCLRLCVVGRGAFLLRLPQGKLSHCRTYL